MVIPGDAARTDDGYVTDRTDGPPACDRYQPGHLVHAAQARNAWASDERVRWGRFERVADGRLVVRFLDGTARYRIHRPADVEAVAEAGDKVRVSERWRVASISRRFEQVLAVCIALPDDRWRPCGVALRRPRSLEGLAAHVRDRGGFMAPGQPVPPFVGPWPEEGHDPPPDGGLGEVS